MRKLVVLLLIALVAGACSDSDTAPTVVTTAPTTTTSTTPATTTTTITPTTTTTLDVTLPEVLLPDVKIEDAREAYRRIVAFVDDLGRNPQPDLLELYYDPSPDCAIYPLIRADIQVLVDNGWRYALLEPTEITRLLPVFQDATTAIVLSNYRIAPDEVYDSEGELVREDPAQVFEKSISLTRSDEFGWRICNAD